MDPAFVREDPAGRCLMTGSKYGAIYLPRFNIAPASHRGITAASVIVAFADIHTLAGTTSLGTGSTCFLVQTYPILAGVKDDEREDCCQED